MTYFTAEYKTNMVLLYWRHFVVFVFVGVH